MTTWLPDVLRAAGLEVTDHGVRGRPGDYEPHGVLNHHTATKASVAKPAPTLGLVQAGRADLPGPLCQVLIGWDGHCHVITTGRANHAGKARESGPMPAGDGNELYVGIEIDYSGYVTPSPEQYAATVKANAAILTRLGRTAAYARGHRETSTTGKWDPGQVDLDRLRADIAAAMTPPPPVTPVHEGTPRMFIVQHPKNLTQVLVDGQVTVELTRDQYKAALAAGVLELGRATSAQWVDLLGDAAR